eukprot:SAG11_NODE_8140_length_1055_cov_4.760460_2_plen_152_part_00
MTRNGFHAHQRLEERETENNGPQTTRVAHAARRDPARAHEGHFRNRCFGIIRERIQAHTFIRWSGPEDAHSEISKDLEKHGLRDAVSNKIISSHSRRKTCASAGMEMGCKKRVMQEWMLTATNKTDTYRERHCVLNKQVQDLLDFLLQRKP